MPSHRPLLDPAYVQTYLDLSENSVMELIEEGLLAPAFQIQCCIDKRRELRILSAGLTYYATAQRPLPVKPSEICADLFPPGEVVTTATLCRVLNASSDLVCSLVKAKAVDLMPGEALRPGHGAAAKVDRRSAVAFLTSRLYIP